MSRTALRRTSAISSALLYHRSAHPGALIHTQHLWWSCPPLRRLGRWCTRLATKTGKMERWQEKEEGQNQDYVLKEPLLDSFYTRQRRIIPSSVALLPVALGSSTDLLEERWLIVKGREGERGGRDQDAPLICHVMMTPF